MAWYDIGGDRGGDPALSSLLPAHLHGFGGVTAIRAGDPVRAPVSFARAAAALTTARERLQRALVATEQALARIRLSEPHAVAGLFHSCLDAAAATGGRVAAIGLRCARTGPAPRHRGGSLTWTTI